MHADSILSGSTAGSTDDIIDGDTDDSIAGSTDSAFGASRARSLSMKGAQIVSERVA